MLVANGGEVVDQTRFCILPTVPSEPQQQDQQHGFVFKILFVSACPRAFGEIRLAREQRIIREAVAHGVERGTLHLDVRSAATIHDLRKAMLSVDYDIVHISGHGGVDGLRLEDEMGGEFIVRPDALARFLGDYASPHGTLKCVIFNACWSRATGEETKITVPYTVAMDGEIGDRAAIEFSRGFYQALDIGKDIRRAFREGRRCVDLAAPGELFSCELLEGPGSKGRYSVG